MPHDVACKKLPYLVIKLLNGAEVTHNYAAKKDVVCVLFDGKEEFIHVEDFINSKTVADSIWNNWIAVKNLNTSYHTLCNTLEIHELASRKICQVYDKKFDGKKKIIAIKGDDSGCGYWRMVLPARQLEEKDFVVDVLTVEVLYQYLMEYDIIFVQRVCSWPSIYVLQRLQKLGKKIIYDIDDNIFDLPDYHPVKKYYGNDEREAACAIMRIADQVVTTTDVLKKYLIEYAGTEIENKIEVIPNAINLNDFKHKLIYPKPCQAKTAPFRIMWSGSATHEYDFYVCMEALDKFLLNHKKDDVRLMFMGYLPMCVRTKSSEEHWQNRVEYLDFKGIETYFNIINNTEADIAIAPLVYDKFNSCKSNIKWQEYTLAGVPTLASSVEPYANTIEHGKDGFLADVSKGPTDWLDILEKKFNYRNDGIWQEVVDNAWKKIDNEFNIAKNIDKWKSLFV